MFFFHPIVVLFVATRFRSLLPGVRGEVPVDGVGQGLNVPTKKGKDRKMEEIKRQGAFSMYSACFLDFV